MTKRFCDFCGRERPIEDPGVTLKTSDGIDVKVVGLTIDILPELEYRKNDIDCCRSCFRKAMLSGLDNSSPVQPNPRVLLVPDKAGWWWFYSREVGFWTMIPVYELKGNKVGIWCGPILPPNTDTANPTFDSQLEVTKETRP